MPSPLSRPPEASPSRSAARRGVHRPAGTNGYVSTWGALLSGASPRG